MTEVNFLASPALSREEMKAAQAALMHAGLDKAATLLPVLLGAKQCVDSMAPAFRMAIRAGGVNAKVHVGDLLAMLESFGAAPTSKEGA